MEQTLENESFERNRKWIVKRFAEKMDSYREFSDEEIRLYNLNNVYYQTDSENPFLHSNRAISPRSRVSEIKSIIDLPNGNVGIGTVSQSLKENPVYGQLEEVYNRAKEEFSIISKTGTTTICSTDNGGYGSHTQGFTPFLSYARDNIMEPIEELMGKFYSRSLSGEEYNSLLDRTNEGLVDARNSLASLINVGRNFAKGKKAKNIEGCEESLAELYGYEDWSSQTEVPEFTNIEEIVWRGRGWMF